MTNLKQKIVLTFGIVLCWWMSVGQTYSVQVSTTIIPPYSIHLADYATSEKIALNILFNDPVRFELAVKLKLTIEGQGITITTKTEFNPTPLYLQSGFPERLSGPDLAQYFDPRNLNFQGVDKRQLEKTGALPEGVYRFCVEVLEYAQNRKVSNTACAVVWMILNDPPIINSPRNGEKIIIQNPQAVMFNWTPRHTGSPNSAFSTEYDFELVEVRSNDRNPNNAILTSPPIYTTTTQSTSLYYGMAETPLIPGQLYAFRVRARAQSGMDEFDLFKNHGYSEVFSFIYGDNCVSPDAIKFEAMSPTSINGSWASLPVHTSFVLRYKENTPNAQWFEKSSMINKSTVASLRPETEYSMQVVGYCGIVGDENVKTYTVKTLKASKTDFVCGAEATAIPVTNTTPMESLAPGQFIESSDFKIALVDVSANANGTFSGRGVAYVPWLRLAGLKVTFKDIKVNNEGKVFQGNVSSVQSADGGWVVKVPVKDSTPPAVVDNTTNGTTGNSSNENSKGDEKVIQVISGTIASVVKDDTGKVVVTDTQGNVTVVSERNGVVKDTAGNTYTVDSTGNVANTTGSANNDGNDDNNNNGTSPGAGTTPSGNTSVVVTKENLDILKDAIAVVSNKTDFTQVLGYMDAASRRQNELVSSVVEERKKIYGESPAASSASFGNVIVIKEISYTSTDGMPSEGWMLFKSYKALEQEYNVLRTLQVICREDIRDEELMVLGKRLVISGKPLSDFVILKKNAGESAEKIKESVADAVIKLVKSQYDVN